MGKKIVIMRRVNQADPSMQAKKDYYSDFFLPLHFLNKIVYIKNRNSKSQEWGVKSVNNIITAGCDIYGPNGITTIRNISRTDKDLVEAISSENNIDSVSVKNITWKVVEIPESIEDYVILGTDQMNESVLFVDETIEAKKFSVVQKDDSCSNDFGWPQSLLEEYVPSIDGKLLYNPLKKGQLGSRSCLQSYNQRGEVKSTRNFQRNSAKLAELAEKFYLTKVLKLSVPHAKVKAITPAFEIAIPIQWT